MAILRRIIIYIILPFLFVGCYEDFDPSITSDPVLCMTSLITTGHPVEVSLTRTCRWNEMPHDDADLAVEEAIVKLYVDDLYVETLEPGEIKIVGSMQEEKMPGYCAHYVAKPGDRIMLTAEHSRLGYAEASVTVPQPVAIDRVETRVKSVNGSLQKPPYRVKIDADFKIYFTDPADTPNFYQFAAGMQTRYYHDDETDAYFYLMADFDFNSEPLFTEHLTAVDHVLAETSGYTFFSDRQISGTQYPLHISTATLELTYRNPLDDPQMPEPEVNFTLESISESYYNHVLSLWLSNDALIGSLGGAGLADAVYSWSNVSTKAGIVAAVSPVSFTVPIIQLPEEGLTP